MPETNDFLNERDNSGEFSLSSLPGGVEVVEGMSSRNIYVDSYAKYKGPIIVNGPDGKKVFNSVEEFYNAYDPNLRKKEIKNREKGGGERVGEDEVVEDHKNEEEIRKRMTEIEEKIREMNEIWKSLNKELENDDKKMEEKVGWKNQNLALEKFKSQDTLTSKNKDLNFDEIEEYSQVIDLKREEKQNDLLHIPPQTQNKRQQTADPSSDSEFVTVSFKFKNFPATIKRRYHSSCRRGNLVILFWNNTDIGDRMEIEENTEVEMLKVDNLGSFNVKYLSNLNVYDLTLDIFLILKQYNS